MPDLVKALTHCLEPFGLGAGVAHIQPHIQPGVRVSRTRLPTAQWPELFQSISAQVRAHHEKQGSGGHVVRRKPIMERERMVVPQGPLKLAKGVTYYDIGEYLTREVLPESLLPLGTSRLGGQPDFASGPQLADLGQPRQIRAHGGSGGQAQFSGPDQPGRIANPGAHTRPSRTGPVAVLL